MSWLIGALLALSQICDRAACDKQGTWTTKALLPLAVSFISRHERLSTYIKSPTHTVLDNPLTETKTSTQQSTHSKSYSLLVTLTLAAGAVLALYTVSTTLLLGLSSVMFAAFGLVLLEYAVRIKEGNRDDAAPVHTLLGRRITINATCNIQQLAVLRDVAAVMALACGLATYLMEPPMASTSITWEPVYRTYKMDWREIHNHRMLLRVLWTLPTNVMANILAFLMISQRGALHASLAFVFAYMCAKLSFATSASSIWFTIIYGLASLLFVTGSASSHSLMNMRNSIRLRRLVFGVAALSIVISIIRHTSNTAPRYPTDVYYPTVPTAHVNTPLGPIPMDLSKGHPAAQLIKAAEAEFQRTLDRQSKSLADAVREYRRRNGIMPPPHFDKWYEFATRNGVVLIDEFDTINQMLHPFWAISPVTLRSRITKAIGHEDSALVAVAIRHGAVENFEKGEEWQQQATVGMMKEFVQYLPDMDLAFNMHDEPRVVIPTSLLSAMVAKARDEVLPRVAKNQTPRNAFSSRPADMNDGTRFAESSTTSFNRFAHQQTWTGSRVSCPSDTQAQTFEDFAADNLTAYAVGPLNYIYNVTAFSDICNSPSLSSTFGFFERPNSFSVTHELMPIFSQSKISSFQDILYPSPWYWMGRVGYDESHDTTWDNKTNSLYWRGSTTGGYSRNGGWRRQHRQHIVRRLNAPDKAHILVPDTDIAATEAAPTEYHVSEIDRNSLSHLIDVKFSHIGQCDPGDCAAQKEFFHVTEHVDAQDAWYYKHLLDMDGNAFSGRFYSLLQSKSLTYKMALFREWHSEWLWPWVHYVPLSLKGYEGLDLVRWFGGEDQGKGKGSSEGEKKAEEIAKRSSEWHNKALRNVDLEVWFFRLLLEYGRVVDDNREEIGYPGP